MTGSLEAVVGQDLLEGLAEHDLVHVFKKLPVKERLHYGRWIDEAANERVRRERIRLFLRVLRISDKAEG